MDSIRRHWIARMAPMLMLSVIASWSRRQKPPVTARDQPARAQIAPLLPAAPRGVGRPISDRAAWQAIAEQPESQQVVHRAEELLSQPIPDLPDELYLDFSKTGNRERCQRVLSQRHWRVTQLVFAECLENQGRFLPAIEQTIRAVCAETTWVMPAHDRSLRNFRGEVNEIDLAVAGFSWELATADYWLGATEFGSTSVAVR